jgi:hypothetical protein
MVSAMKELLSQQISVHGCKLTQEAILDLLHSDVILNVQGLECWVDQVQAS